MDWYMCANAAEAVLALASLLYMGLPAEAQDANSYGQNVPQQHYTLPDAQHSMAATNASQASVAQTAINANYATNAGSAVSCTGGVNLCYPAQVAPQDSPSPNTAKVSYSEAVGSGYCTNGATGGNVQVEPVTGNNWAANPSPSEWCDDGGSAGGPEWTEAAYLTINTPVTYCTSTVIDSNGQTTASNGVPTGNYGDTTSSGAGTLKVIMDWAVGSGNGENNGGGWPSNYDPGAHILVSCWGSTWAAIAPPPQQPVCRPCEPCTPGGQHKAVGISAGPAAAKPDICP